MWLISLLLCVVFCCVCFNVGFCNFQFVSTIWVEVADMLLHFLGGVAVLSGLNVSCVPSALQIMSNGPCIGKERPPKRG